jgi:hydrogenase maturation factor
LIAVAKDGADRLVRALERQGTPARAVIGEIVASEGIEVTA